MADEIQSDNPESWPEPVRETPQKPVDLPPSDNKEFWVDGEIHQIPVDDEGRPIQGRPDMTHHYFEKRNTEIICTGCPFEHSGPDFNKFDCVDGKLVPLN